MFDFRAMRIPLAKMQTNADCDKIYESIKMNFRFMTAFMGRRKLGSNFAVFWSLSLDDITHSINESHFEPSSKRTVAHKNNNNFDTKAEIIVA